jgi:curved DNA-binding protein CbpA
MINKYLKILNLEADSTLDDARKAYRKLAKQNHPDRFTGKNHGRD